MPYSYELTMFRRNTRDDIEPADLIGTACSIGINIRRDNDPQGPEMIVRKGVFEHFERVSGGTRDFRVYYARMVPAFKLAGNETRYRVFENLDPVQIIEQSLGELSHMRLNVAALRQERFPKLEYCVQFAETTFGFVSRIMSRFGMWYIFDHDRDPQSETLVVGHSQVNLIKNATLAPVNLLDSRPSDIVAIYNVVRKYDPASSSVSSGGFNPLKPSDPFQGTSNIQKDYAVVNEGTARRFTRATFADPVLSNAEAAEFAKNQIKREESAVYTITGDSNNPSFLAGTTFVVSEDLTNDTKNDEDVPSARIFGTGRHKYLITYLSILATVGHIGQTAATTLADLWKDLTKTVGTGETLDVTAGITNGMLGNYISNQQQTAWTNVYYGGADAVKFLPSLTTGAVGSMVGLVPSLIAAVKDVAQSHGSQYGNSFIAVPFNPPAFALPPPAAAPRPVAHGPHLAVVIGPDGATPTDGRDIFADALGRVRVRFPWDPGPPQPSAVGPFETGKNTCWVRVSEGWAGASFGTQFLPRVGQQVLVGFIDGDPEQPIITGRIYAATRGPADLPFQSPSAQGKALTMNDVREPQASSNMARSGIKTRSTPSPGGPGAGFHLLRLDDTKGQEQFLIRSQGRRDDTSLRSRFETTNGSRHVLVRAGKDDNGGAIGGGAFMSVGGENDLIVGGDHLETLNGNWEYSVKGTQKVEADAIFSFVKNFHEMNAKQIDLEAKTKISLKVGNSSVVITPAGVYIDGPFVKINAGGAAEAVSSVDMTDAVGAAESDPGDPPNFLALQPKGGGGGKRRSRHIEPQHGVPVTALPNGKLRLGPGPVTVDTKGASPAFLDGVANDYDAWKQRPGSGDAEERMRKSGKTVEITPADPKNPGVAEARPFDPEGAVPSGQKLFPDKPFVGTGKGSGTRVTYDPSSHPAGGPSSSGEVFAQGMDQADKNARGNNPDMAKGFQLPEGAGPRTGP